MRLLLLLLLSSAGSSPAPTGDLKGRVVDVQTKAPLAAVGVSLAGTDLTTTTDARGSFAIAGVPVGSYNLVFKCPGRADLLRPEILVQSARTTFVNAEMAPVVWRHQELVTVDSAASAEPAPLAVHAFGAQELQRTAPGGDLSRALFVMPGVVQVDDMANDLIVRGGSPTENGYYIDNIPIPNINHFPQEGATGGNITMVNLDFVEDVQLLTGGFGPRYGGRLSSIVDIRWREGDRTAVKGRLDLSMTGFGGGIEGPLPGRKGSWMISARRSYLDLLAHSINLGSLDAQFADVQGKVVYDLGPRHRLTLLDVFGRSSGSRDEASAVLNGDSQGHDDVRQHTVGVNWRALWGTRGFSDTSVSYASVRNDSRWSTPGSASPPYRRDYADSAFSLRNVNRVKLGSRTGLELGVEGSWRDGRAYNMPTANVITYSSLDGSAFAACTLSGRLSGSLGLRADRDPFNGDTHIGPRVSASFAVGQRLTLSAAVGVYEQTLPFSLLKQAPLNRRLPSLQATHAVVGLGYQLSSSTRLTVEAYDKEYRDFPLSAEMPTRFVIDDVAGNEKGFWDYGTLVASGRAYSRGVELMIQKRLVRDLYGIVSGSFFRTRYRDLEGVWHNRIHDNMFVANVTGGYRPNKYWDLTVRWLLAGGKGSTPYYVWTWTGGGNADVAWDKWMSTHLPPYHTLGLRVDRRVYYRKRTLSFYLGVWNAYDRKNVRYYYWNSATSRLDAAYQWGRIPYFGVELDL